MLPAQPNQSLIDGLACLQMLAARSEPIGSRELARQLKLEPTRVNRLLKTLSALGLAQQNAQRKYLPGPGIHVLAAQALFGSGLIRRSIAPLEDLRRPGWVVALGVLWRDRVSYLYHASYETPPSAALGRVALYPAVRSSIGHVLLAARDEAEVRALLSDSPEAAGRIAEIMQALALARTEGFATVRIDAKTRSVAAPLGQPPYAALAVSGDIATADVPGVVDLLRAAAARV
jgi:DNA-binding IclR family transcriptional regulator